MEEALTHASRIASRRVRAPTGTSGAAIDESSPHRPLQGPPDRLFRNSQQHDRRLSHFQPLSASSLSATAGSFKPRSVAPGQGGNAFKSPRSPQRGGRSCSKTVVRASIPQTSLMRSKGQGRGRRKTTPSASLHPMRQIVHPSGHSTYLPLRNCPTNHATARGCVCPPRPCARPCFRSSSAALG